MCRDKKALISKASHRMSLFASALSHFIILQVVKSLYIQSKLENEFVKHALIVILKHKKWLSSPSHNDKKTKQKKKKKKKKQTNKKQLLCSSFDLSKLKNGV